MREGDQYTSPLDDADEETDYSFELPDAGEGVVVIVHDDAGSATLTRTILEADYCSPLERSLAPAKLR